MSQAEGREILVNAPDAQLFRTQVTEVPATSVHVPKAPTLYCTLKSRGELLLLPVCLEENNIELYPNVVNSTSQSFVPIPPS